MTVAYEGATPVWHRRGGETPSLLSLLLPPRRKESTARELLMESIRFARWDENCPKYFTQKIGKIFAVVPKPDRA